MEGELLCLKWRDHYSSFFRTLSSVRKKEDPHHGKQSLDRDLITSTKDLYLWLGFFVYLAVSKIMFKTFLNF